MLDDTDEETARLIVRPQLEDIDALAPATTSENPSSDETVAVQTYEAELNDYQAVRLAYEDENEPAGGEATAAEAASRSDQLDQQAPTQGSSIPDVSTFRCVVCEEHFVAESCWRAPCNHYYCDEHLEDLFRRCLTDITLYPPRCCGQTMEIDDVKSFLSEKLTKDFEAKKPELDDARPLYCHVLTCLKYIGQEPTEASVATCPECHAKTCVICKQSSHTDDCKDDAATRETLALAEEKGWRACPHCGQVVELRSGCNHMT